MTRRTGDMFDYIGEADLFLVTANSCLRKDGSLVMGAGAARQLRGRVRGIAQGLGRRVRKECGHLGTYGLIQYDSLIGSYSPDADLGAFQVKRHWKNKANPELIAESAALLSVWSQENPGSVAFVNYPGIGNGGLSRSDVAPIITPWPDNIHVWTYN